MEKASSSSHHYPLSGGYDAVSLYAAPLDSGWSSLDQLVLPGFGELIHSQKDTPPMKGVWSGEKSVGSDYRPAIDSLMALDSELLRKFVATVVATGAAVSFSVTRDYGAVVLTILDGNQRHKVYPTDLQELTEALKDGIESFTPSQTPPNTGKPRR